MVDPGISIISTFSSVILLCGSSECHRQNDAHVTWSQASASGDYCGRGVSAVTAKVQSADNLQDQGHRARHTQQSCKLRVSSLCEASFSLQ